MAQSIAFKTEGLSYLKEGIHLLAELMKPVYGIKGYSGVALAKELKTLNSFTSIGYALGKQSMEKMDRLCGDGSKTAIILTASILNAAHKAILDGASREPLLRGIKKACQQALCDLKNSAVMLNSKERVINYLGDEKNSEIAPLIAEAFAKLGQGGTVLIGKGNECTLTFTKGFSFESGYCSPHFWQSGDELIQLEAPRILVCSKPLDSPQELLPILQIISASKQPLLLIAPEFGGELLSTLSINRVANKLEVFTVKVEGNAEKTVALLEDIALFTGSTLLKSSQKLKTTTPEMLGSAERVIVDKERTHLLCGHGSAKGVASRISTIEKELSKTYETTAPLLNRKKQLDGVIALINPGEGHYLRALQLLRAAGLAMEMGSTPTGIAALCDIQLNLSELSGDELLGAEVFHKALHSPLAALTNNREKLKNGTQALATKVLLTALTCAYASAEKALLTRTLIA